MADLLDETVRLTHNDKTTTFFIRRLLVEEQLDLWEEIRPQLDGTISALSPIIDMLAERDDAGGSAESLRTMSPEQLREAILATARIATGIPRGVTDAIRERLFREILWQKPGVTTPRELYGNINSAFEFLTMAHAYEIMVRAMAINFHDSWAVIQSLIDQPDQGTQRPFTPTSIPS